MILNIAVIPSLVHTIMSCRDPAYSRQYSLVLMKLLVQFIIVCVTISASVMRDVRQKYYRYEAIDVSQSPATGSLS